MKSPGCVLLCVAMLLAGCSATNHGPATRVISAKTTVRNVMTSAEEVDRQTVRESQLSDAGGGKWTQTELVSSERIPLSQLEVKLFQEALSKPVSLEP
jgi:hypothetical protein